MTGQPVSVTATAHDPSPGESALTDLWVVSKNGAGYMSGTGTSFSFTPNGPGQYTTTLAVTDPAGRSSTQSATTLVGSSNLVVNSALEHRYAPGGRVDAGGSRRVRQRRAGGVHDHLRSIAGQPDDRGPHGSDDRRAGDAGRHGGAGLILSGGGVAGTLGSVSVLTVAQGAIVTIQDLTIANGSSLYGGGIDNNGTLTVVAATIENNTADRGRDL